MGYKDFVNFTVLDESDLDLLMKQSIMTFTSASARDTALPAPTAGMVAYTTGLWLRHGGAWHPVPHSLVAYKTADESVASNATPQDDDDLFVTVDADATYTVDAFIIGVVPGGSVIDLRVGFSFPADSTLHWGVHGPAVAMAGGSTTAEGVFTAHSADAVSPTANVDVGAAWDPTMTIARGLLVTGAGGAGTFRLKWSQVASNVAETKILAGSWLRLDRIR